VQATTFPNPSAGPRSFPVERWPTEIPLFALSILVSIPIWFFLVFSIIGIAYAIGIGAFLFIVHLGLVARVRGSGVRLSHEQFPELYERVQTLAREMGIQNLPDVYLVQAGGTLNAFATKFLGAHLVVLYTDLLDACGNDTAARDMIVAHELGHIHAGHLRWRWLTAPSHLIPFLGMALSRAREYTCDRYGHVGAGDHDGALRGLTLLAAGPIGARAMNRAAFVRQGADLQTGWMTIGEWFATHPPLSKRVAALDMALAALVPASSRGVVRALAILGCLYMVPLVSVGVALALFPAWLKRHTPAVPAATAAALEAPPSAAPSADSDDAQSNERPVPKTARPKRTPAEQVAARALVTKDLLRLSSLLESERRAGHPLPWDARRLGLLWSDRNSGEDIPEDPFGTDGDSYRYDQSGGEYLLWSVGPDAESDSDDDIVFDSRVSVPSASRRAPGPPARHH
jgi:Zn-dependent protease with chaperone function